MQTHPGYLKSDQPSSPSTDKNLAEERQAILQLAWQKDARPTLEFVACCHPRPENRALARGVKTAAELTNWFCQSPELP